MIRKIAVIIPYFQKDAGILRRSIKSVIEQHLNDLLSIHIFIVDDESPWPAESEIEGLDFCRNVTATIYHQKNGGPGSARNTGLFLAESHGGFSFISFLDSDDEWKQNHIIDAVEKLDHGYDLYFCDNIRNGIYDLYSEELAALRSHGAAIEAKANWSDERNSALGFPPLALVDEMVASCLCHTSAIVCRAELTRGKRFDQDLRSAGEDHFLWLNMTLSGAKIVISWAANVVCGRGVNIFFSAFDWNLPATVERMGNLAIFGQKLCRLSGLSEKSREVVRAKSDKYRRAYGFLLMRTLLRGNLPKSAAFTKLVRLDPLFPIRVPWLFFSLLLDRDPAARKF